MGKTELEELKTQVNDRLFELRQMPTEVSDEENFLSGIELMICEVEDGFRTSVELEEYLKLLISPMWKPVVWGNNIDMSSVFSSSTNTDAKWSAAPEKAVTNLVFEGKFA
jgi:hypothetical protein